MHTFHHPVLLFLLLIHTFAFAQKPDTREVTYDSHSLKIDGKEIFVYGAAFHYFRCPKELWRDRFSKIKAAGFNTVETYIPWNVHELNMPKDINDSTQFNFTDIKDWLKMAQNEFGFYTIVRPGPFICAEWAGGGYPRWLAKFRPNMEGFWLRSADPEHIKWCEHWYKAVCKIIAAEEITRKPKNKKGIILMQIENEYDAHDTNNKTLFLEHLYNAAKQAGVKVPVFTCLTSQCRGAKGGLSAVFDCDNYYVDRGDAITCALRMESLKNVQPNAPGFVTELQGGWFSTVMGKLSEEHPSDAAHFYAMAMMSIAGGATGLIQYVTYGGTHFAGWGARGQTTSYDYNAAIRENGSLSPKYSATRNVGKFIAAYGPQLISSRGGVCSFLNGAKELAGAVRISSDGTQFVFLHNHSSENKISGEAVVQAQNRTPAKPMYNINQNEEKVEISAARTKNNSADLKPFPISYQLMPMQTTVLIIPPGKTAVQGKWWLWNAAPVTPKKEIVIPVTRLLKYNEDARAEWKPLEEGKSLPELGVNDARYVLYRAQFSLQENEVSQYGKLLFHTFSRDILNVQVNGQPAPRLYPSEKWAALVWRETGKSFKKIKDDDCDNRFDVSHLLRSGKNEIVAVYENIGHEHGYYPMEELCGIRKAGLSDTETDLKKPLSWEVSTDLAGIQQQFTSPSFEPKNWQPVSPEENYVIPEKGNEIQPKGKQDGLLTWYRAEFTVPEISDNTWRLLINASGNGYMYLNGHNLGRHWEAGPQRAYYLPECWIKKGKNILVLGLRQTVNGALIRGMEIKNYTE